MSGNAQAKVVPLDGGPSYRVSCKLASAQDKNAQEMFVLNLSEVCCSASSCMAWPTLVVSCLPTSHMTGRWILSGRSQSLHPILTVSNNREANSNCSTLSAPKLTHEDAANWGTWYLSPDWHGSHMLVQLAIPFTLAFSSSF